MNLTAKGKIEAMEVLLKYDKYPLSLIRPLALLEERQVIACAAEKGLLKAACTCPYGVKSERRLMREKIAAFTGGNGAVKRRIFKAIN
jgi:tRNA 2-thiocytidine biosynthesis protein TtcA